MLCVPLGRTVDRARAVVCIWHLCGRVVAPDADLLNVVDGGTELKRNLCPCAVVICVR